MPRRPKPAVEGLVFHLLNRSAKRATLFEDARDYDAFVDALRAGTARLPISVYAYCVMPNHWHLVASSPINAGISRFMHWLTTTHARRWQLSKRKSGEGAVYQGRYRAVPVSTDRHFLWLCRYVERNALRASLVTRAEDWPWSSLAHRSKICDAEWLSPWPILPPQDWTDYVNRPQSATEVEAIRTALARGEPWGKPDWRTHLKELSCGGSDRRPRGRPRKSVPV